MSNRQTVRDFAKTAALLLVPLIHLVFSGWAWTSLAKYAVYDGAPLPLILLGIGVLVGGEVGITALYERRHAWRWWWVLGVVIRVAFLAWFLYVTTVVVAAIDPSDYKTGQSFNATPYRLVVSHFWCFASWELFPMAHLLAMVWVPLLGIYAYVWPRWRLGRITLLVLLPAVWGFVVFQGFYYDWLVAAPTDAELESQPGVEVVVPLAVMEQATSDARMIPNKFTARFPRNLAEDGSGRLLAAYGHTLKRDAVDYQGSPYLFSIDPKAGTARAAPPTGRLREIQAHPRSGRLFTCSWDRSDLLEIDTEEMKIVNELQIGHEEHISFWEPMVVTAPPGREDLFIANDLAPAMSRVHRETGEWLGTLDLGRYSPPGGSAWRLLWSPTREVLFVAVNGLDSIALQIDPDRLEVISDYAARSDIDYATAMVLGPSERYLYTQQTCSSDVLRIDVDSGEVKRVGSGLRGGRGIAVDAFDRRVFVSGWLHHEVKMIDTETGETETVEVGHKPNGIIRIGGVLYVLSVNGLVRIDPQALWGVAIE